MFILPLRTKLASWLSASTLDLVFGATFCKSDDVEMRTEKQVTFLPRRRVLRKPIVPSYFYMIPLVDFVLEEQSHCSDRR